jgi:hypothetical protein
MHAFAVSTMQQPQYGAPPPGFQPSGYPPSGYPPPGYAPQPPGSPGFGYPPQGGNPLGGFLNSGFGRAIETGLGFGLGDDLINKIF